MKKTLLTLLLAIVAIVGVAQKKDTCCTDLEDKCRWSVRTSIRKDDNIRKEQINIFVKHGNRLEWHNENGIKVFYVYLYLCSPNENEYNYIVCGCYKKMDRTEIDEMNMKIKHGLIKFTDQEDNLIEEFCP